MYTLSDGSLNAIDSHCLLCEFNSEMVNSLFNSLIIQVFRFQSAQAGPWMELHRQEKLAKKLAILDIPSCRKLAFKIRGITVSTKTKKINFIGGVKV